VQVSQQLAVDAVLNRVHHLSLSQHSLALLLNAAGQELRLKCNLSQSLEHLWCLQ
jgi:hypothetical protein